jgi:mRNA interferase MazF
VDFERFDVVIVPFPFTDKAQTKRRPALVLSQRTFGHKAGHSVMAMITSANNPPWPLDVAIADLDAAGLPAASMVRMKLFTLDHRFVLAKRGKLANRDRKAVATALATLLGG